MLFLGLIKKICNFYFENLDDTAPIGNQLSSYPGIKDTQVSEKYLQILGILDTRVSRYQSIYTLFGY